MTAPNPAEQQSQDDTRESPEQVAERLVQRCVRSSGAIEIYVGTEVVAVANTGAFATATETRLRRAVAAAISADRAARQTD